MMMEPPSPHIIHFGCDMSSDPMEGAIIAIVKLLLGVTHPTMTFCLNFNSAVRCAS